MYGQKNAPQRFKSDGDDPNEASIIELKQLLTDVTAKFKTSQEAQVALTKKNDELETKLSGLLEKFEASEDAGEIKSLKTKLEDLENELSDVRTKRLNTAPQYDEKSEKLAMKQIAGASIKSFILSKAQGDIFDYIQTKSADQFKTLNITDPDAGGRAIAQTLARDVLEYAREFSPILNLVGTKNGLTRDYRQIVKVAYPKVRRGVENVAGADLGNTDTQLYKEVKANVFKVSAEPRLTQEAMSAPDIDIYADLVADMGTELAVFLANDVLYGQGADKEARGILGSRLDIADLTGESWKPTLAADPANARSADVYPAIATGVSGSIGVDNEASVNFVIDVCNSLPTMYLAGAGWVMNRNTKGMFEKLRYADGKPVFRTDYMDGKFRLNGFPLVIDDTMPDIGADAPFAIFGDLSKAYAIGSGDIDFMQFNPYKVRGCTVVEYDKEMIEIVQKTDAVRVLVATANAGA